MGIIEPPKEEKEENEQKDNSSNKKKDKKKKEQEPDKEEGEENKQKMYSWYLEQVKNITHDGVLFSRVFVVFWFFLLPSGKTTVLTVQCHYMANYMAGIIGQ